MVLCSLSEANIDIARNIIEAEPTADSFQQLQEALVASHTKSEFQKVNHVVNMEPLNGHKPMELLAAMSKYRPLFCLSLPAEIAGGGARVAVT
jgi:hypothetical protein